MGLAENSREGSAGTRTLVEDGPKQRCRISREYEEAGDYESAREALGEFWRRVGERPEVDGLAPDAAAEVLLQVARLTCAPGSAGQVGGSQELAKNLLSESIAIFERLGDEKKVAEAQSELGHCYWLEGAFEEAHEHLLRARGLFARLKDAGSAAQVDETRARLLIAEGKFAEAERLAHGAARALEAGGEKSLLAKALVTRGVALARAGRDADANLCLRRAIDTAEQDGDPDGAGQAALTLAEELGGVLTARAMREIFERASALLSNSQNPSTLARLNALARRTVEALTSSPAALVVPAREGGDNATAEERWHGFSLKREVLRYEAELIERALRDSAGVVSRASKLLGFNHHQTFVALLNNRHRNLLHARRPIVPRKRNTVRAAPRR